jgi:hypothetical protein
MNTVEISLSDLWTLIRQHKKTYSIIGLIFFIAIMGYFFRLPQKFNVTQPLYQSSYLNGGSPKLFTPQPVAAQFLLQDALNEVLSSQKDIKTTQQINDLSPLYKNYLNQIMGGGVNQPLFGIFYFTFTVPEKDIPTVLLINQALADELQSFESAYIQGFKDNITNSLAAKKSTIAMLEKKQAFLENQFSDKNDNSGIDRILLTYVFESDDVSTQMIGLKNDINNLLNQEASIKPSHLNGALVIPIAKLSLTIQIIISLIISLFASFFVVLLFNFKALLNKS